jgi:hypothetical protein
MNDIVFARAVLLALAVLFMLAGFSFSALMLRFRSDSRRRLQFGVPLLAALVVLVFFQFNSYSNLTGLRKPIDDDAIFFWIIIFECVVVFGGIFYSAYRRRGLA